MYSSPTKKTWYLRGSPVCVLPDLIIVLYTHMKMFLIYTHSSSWQENICSSQSSNRWDILTHSLWGASVGLLSTEAVPKKPAVSWGYTHPWPIIVHYSTRGEPGPLRRFRQLQLGTKRWIWTQPQRGPALPFFAHFFTASLPRQSIHRRNDQKKVVFFFRPRKEIHPGRVDSI